MLHAGITWDVESTDVLKNPTVATAAGSPADGNDRMVARWTLLPYALHPQTHTMLNSVVQKEEDKVDGGNRGSLQPKTSKAMRDEGKLWKKKG